MINDIFDDVPEVKPALVPAPVPKPFKPMAVVPRNPRCAELYPNGGNFKTIS